MRLTVNSYDGHTINDTSYSAFIPLTDRNLLSLAPTQAIEVERGENYPFFAGKILSGKNFVVQVNLLGTYSTQIDTLKTWFDTRNNIPKKLLLTDPLTSLQWYIMCTCLDMPKRDTVSAQFLMYAADPVLTAEVATTENWLITASGQTKAITPAGNVFCKPKITLMPTASKNGGYDYKSFCILKNPSSNSFVNYPYELTNGGMDTAALIKVDANKVQINDVAGITDVQTTIPYDNEAGTFPAAGIAYIDGATKEQISYTGKTATDLTGVTRGLNGTTAAAHADDIWIFNSLVQADGDDIRIMVDGVETSRWLYGMNTANTKIWINIDLAPLKATKIQSLIASSGAVTSIPLFYSTITAKTKKKKKKTTVDATLSLAFLNGINSTGGLVMIDNEIFRYTGVDLSTYTLTGVTRAANGTSMAEHLAEAAITFIEHDVWLMYGNPGETPIYQDETAKPIIDLSSTNTSWIYAEFATYDGLRSGSWKPAVKQTVGKQSNTYGGDHGTNADPAAVMGMAIKSYSASGRWKAESAIIEWTLYHPAGVTHVSSDGELYRNTTSWPIYAYLYKGTVNGTKWDYQWNLTTPATVSTRTAWTKNSQALGATYNYLKYYFAGAVGALAEAEANFEVANVTLTLDSSKTPACTILTAQPNYWMDCKITNNTTGEWLSVSYMMALNSVITIDCKEKTAMYNDNTNILGAVEFSTVRMDWLNILPGANTIQYDDEGTDDITAAIIYNSRNN